MNATASSTCTTTCNLKFCQWGQPYSSALPVVMLHGHPGNGAAMAVFGETLGQDRWALAPDLRGYGASRITEPFELSVHLEDVDALLNRLGIGNCILLGWSLGGIVAMELALQHPQRIKGLILVATAANPHGNHPPIRWQDKAFTAIAGTVNWLRPGWQWNINTFGKHSLFRFLVRRHTPNTYQYLAKSAVAAYLQTSRQANRALRRALQRGYNRVTDVESLSIPTVMLAGECDLHITAASSKETADALNARWIEYPNTAHLFPWEVPRQVQNDIQQWLNEQDLLAPTDNSLPPNTSNNV
ncbi:MAG: alpha/beta hydrolase [Cyanobacteria bacterium P01_E01_bin.34]